MSPAGPARGRAMQRPQPRTIVFELQLAAVQARDRGGEAQPQAGARQRPALLKPHETLDDATAIGVGNAWSVIGDTTSEMRSPSASAPSTISAAAPLTLLASGPAYLIALSTRFASAWLTSSRLPRTGAETPALRSSATRPFSSAERFVQLADVARDLGRVELDHVVARLPGFGARDHQQRIEGADQLVGFGDGGFERGPVVGFAARRCATLARSGCACGSAAS